MDGRMGKVERAVVAALEAPGCLSPSFMLPALSTAQLVARCYADGAVTPSRLVVMRRTVRRLAEAGVVTTHYEGQKGVSGRETFARLYQPRP